MKVTELSRYYFPSRTALPVYVALALCCAVVALYGPSLALVLGIDLCILAFFLWDKEVIWISIAFIGDLFYAWNWNGKALLPKEVQWISHFVIGVAILKIFLNVTVHKKRVPAIAFPIFVISLFGIIRALTLGESFLAIAWGWFVMFKYVIIALYLFYALDIPDRFVRGFFWVCLSLIIFELLIQIPEYLSGIPPGDSLAGTFGLLGTHELILLDTIVCCWAAARFIVNDDLWPFVVSLGVSAVSSVFCEGKVFIVIMTVLALSIIVLKKHGTVVKKALYLGVGALSAWGFLTLYSMFFKGETPLSYVLFPDLTSKYVENIRYLPETGYYDVGRLASLQISFAKVSGSPSTLLSGFGCGSATASQTLGISGSVIKAAGAFMFWRGSLSHILLEYGLLGYVAILAIIVILLRIGWRMLNEGSLDREIGFTIILYTLLLPLLLFYTYALEVGIPNIIFWSLVGYALWRTEGCRST
jgi:hypothetical protein